MAGCCDLFHTGNVQKLVSQSWIMICNLVVKIMNKHNIFRIVPGRKLFQIPGLRIDPDQGGQEKNGEIH